MADFRVRRGINRARAIVKNQDLRLFQQCPRNTEPLLLTAGNIASALLDISIVAVRQLPDELIRTGKLAGADTFLLGSVFIAPAQIFQNGA